MLAIKSWTNKRPPGRKACHKLLQTGTICVMWSDWSTWDSIFDKVSSYTVKTLVSSLKQGQTLLLLLRKVQSTGSTGLAYTIGCKTATNSVKLKPTHSDGPSQSTPSKAKHSGVGWSQNTKQAQPTCFWLSYVCFLTFFATSNEMLDASSVCIQLLHDH